MSSMQVEPAIVRPSRFVRVVMRPMTRSFNPIVLRMAGRTHFATAAQIHHVGRRSGRAHVTPVSARRFGNDLFIPLTFSRQSDWCRNVLAHGGCTIRLKGVDYTATDPRVVGRNAALASASSAFRRFERFMFRPLGIEEFLVLQIVDDVRVETVSPPR